MKKFRKKGQSIYEGFIGMDVIDKETALLHRLKQSGVNVEIYNLSEKQKFLIARLANINLNDEQLEKIQKLISE